MKFDEAANLAQALTARLNELGYDVTIKAYRPHGSTKKTEWTVKPKVMVTKKNLMTGAEFEIDEDEPLHLDPSSETYWSM